MSASTASTVVPLDLLTSSSPAVMSSTSSAVPVSSIDLTSSTTASSAIDRALINCAASASPFYASVRNETSGGTGTPSSSSSSKSSKNRKKGDRISSSSSSSTQNDLFLPLPLSNNNSTSQPLLERNLSESSDIAAPATPASGTTTPSLNGMGSSSVMDLTTFTAGGTRRDGAGGDDDGLLDASAPVSASTSSESTPTTRSRVNSNTVQPEQLADLGEITAASDVFLTTSHTGVSVDAMLQMKGGRRGSNGTKNTTTISNNLTTPTSTTLPASNSAPSLAGAKDGTTPALNVDASPNKGAAAAAGANKSSSATSAAASSSSSRGIFNRLFNPFGNNNNSGTTPVSSPTPTVVNSSAANIPPVHIGVTSSSTNSSATSAISSFTPFGSTPISTPATSFSTTAALASSPSTSTSTPVPSVVIPKSYTYQDFAAKMKLPGAQDLVKQLKTYVKYVQSNEWTTKHALQVMNIPVVTNSTSRLTAASPATSTSTTTTTTTPLASSTDQYDRIRIEYNDLITHLLKTIRTRHPLWRGSTEEEIDNSLESIEKFLTSKLYERFFGLFIQDRIRDDAFYEKLSTLHTWILPQHLDLPPYYSPPHTDLTIWDSAAHELCNMEKFKSPKDKLVCLLNCCHIINNILKKGKVKVQMEKEMKERERVEKERVAAEAAAAATNAASQASAADSKRKGSDAKKKSPAKDSNNNNNRGNNKSKASNVTYEQSDMKDIVAALMDTTAASALSSASNSDITIDPSSTESTTAIPPSSSSFAPSSSPSADDFFPALIFTIIHARPAHLILNLQYISLCRYEPKLSGGEAAYWFTTLASAIAFIEQANEKSFTFSGCDKNPAKAKEEYLARMEEGRRIVKEEEEKEEEVKKRVKEEEAAISTEPQSQTDKATTATSSTTKSTESDNSKQSIASPTPSIAPGGLAIAPLDPSSPSTAPPVAESSPLAAVAVTSPSSSSLLSPSSSTTVHTHTHTQHHHTSSTATTSSSSSSTTDSPPCLACLHLSHRRVPQHFLDREFSSLTISELQDVLREYKELCFVLQGWQEQQAHAEMRKMPIPTSNHAASSVSSASSSSSSSRSTNYLSQYGALSGDDLDVGVALTEVDAESAAPNNSTIAAASSVATQSGALSSSSLTSATSASSSSSALSSSVASSVRGGWQNFLGLGRATTK